MAKQFEKAPVPTAKLEIACDQFQSFLTSEMHETDKMEHKMKISIRNTKGEEHSVSLYAEDVRAHIAHLNSLIDSIEER